MKRETKLKNYLLKNKKKVNKLNKQFTKLFNDCGKKYDDCGVQLGLLGAIVLGFLEATTIPKKQKLQLLKNCSKRIKEKN